MARISKLNVNEISTLNYFQIKRNALVYKLRVLIGNLVYQKITLSKEAKNDNIFKVNIFSAGCQEFILYKYISSSTWFQRLKKSIWYCN